MGRLWGRDAVGGKIPGQGQVGGGRIFDDMPVAPYRWVASFEAPAGAGVTSGMLKFLRDRMEGERGGQRRPERRSAARLDKVFPVWLEGERGAGMGVARNISEGGMFVETRVPHPLAAQVRITFPSPSGEMTAVAEVRYVCHLMGRLSGDATVQGAVHGMGVRFLYFEARPGELATVH
jgi:hypothetical protein